MDTFASERQDGGSNSASRQNVFGTRERESAAIVMCSAAFGLLFCTSAAEKLLKYSSQIWMRRPQDAAAVLQAVVW